MLTGMYIYLKLNCMKEFIKFTFATVLGLVIFSVVTFLLTLFVFIGIVTSSDTETKVEPDSVFYLELNGTLQERALENPFSFLSETDSEIIGLDDVLSAISKAKDNENIAGIYINAVSLAASYASIDEIRTALADFKESGKFVVAYSDSYSQGLYYLASVADKVYLNPSGVVDWRGLSAQTVFFKDLLDKVGVNMQIFKVGTYKSAVEPFINTEMSEANREQVNAYIGSIWNNMLDGVSVARNITTGRLVELADEGALAVEAGSSVSAGMVDSLVYKNDMKLVLANMLGVEEDDMPDMLSLAQMNGVQRSVPKDKSGNVIAVYYAEGDIVDQGETGIVSEKVIKDIKELRKDDDVKAVVIRVNSPGGSAFGSEQMWKEINDLKQEKPVVVSMGDYAASGGYYMSCNADYIFAQPSTLTGSIGIFGMIPDGAGLASKVGVTFESVNTNRFSDLGALYRPMNNDEKALIQTSVNNGYELFVKRCADGRKMPVDEIKKIAEGRVWTGLMAKELGLVDEIGGINDAIEMAKHLAGIESYTLLSYPEKGSVLDEYLSALQYVSMSAKTPEEMIREIAGLSNGWNSKFALQARIPYYIELR